MPESSEPPTPTRILRGGAVLFLLIGFGIAVWLIDKAFRYPEIQASQFGYKAPLWVPATVFVLGATAAGVYVLLRAARRVEQGEDLFALRHRRRPDAASHEEEREPPH